MQKGNVQYTDSLPFSIPVSEPTHIEQSWLLETISTPISLPCEGKQQNTDHHNTLCAADDIDVNDDFRKSENCCQNKSRRFSAIFKHII